MNKSDLKIDDYYYAEYHIDEDLNGYCIIKGTIGQRPNLYTGNSDFYKSNNCSAKHNIRLATPEEKHWLDTCIKANKFITEDEAMKSFIPDFVLPKNWCINVENREIGLEINRTWAKTTYYIPFPLGINYFKGCKTKYIGWSDKLNKDYVELTFEQFKKYVLKEETIKDVMVKIDNKHLSKHSLESIEKALLNNYDKDDVQDIIKTLTKHLK